jgi:hypothetical protein
MSNSDTELDKGTGRGTQIRTGGRLRSLSRALRFLPRLFCLTALYLGVCGSECDDGPPGEQAWDKIESFSFSYDVDWTSKGDGLKLSWACPGDVAYCERYELSYKDKSGDKMSVIGKNETSVYWPTPCTNMQLRAFYNWNGKKGYVPSKPVALPTVVTTTLTLYGLSDQTRPNGFAVSSTDWTARGVTYAERAGAAVWFVVKDVGEELFLVSPSTILPEGEWGVRENYSVAVAEDFDDLSHCPGHTEAVWSLTTELVVGRTYALWHGTFGTWSVTDDFAKVKVLAINGNEVTLKLAVSPFPGLRWVITP